MPMRPLLANVFPVAVFLWLLGGCESVQDAASKGSTQPGSGSDTDGDGFVDDDCAEGDAGTHPGAVEACDGVDNDCDGLVDEEVTRTFYPDADGDGHGDADTPLEACVAPADAVPTGGDCADDDPSRFPGAEEVCDGVDNDCNGVSDDAGESAWYPDADGDGWGEEAGVVWACAAPPDTIARGGDCDDTEAAVYPDAPELCDELDNDCDSEVDEGVSTIWYEDRDADGYGLSGRTTEACSQPEGYAPLAGDCDETDPARHPDAPEPDCADPVDYNCDGSVTWTDADLDGFAACEECDDTDPARNPDAIEVCGGGDEDCDGLVDMDDPSLDGSTRGTYYADVDLDGFGDALNAVTACDLPVGFVADATDCNDLDAAIRPDALEVCGGGDEDCDGLADDADPSLDPGGLVVYYVDGDGDGFGGSGLSVAACSAPVGYVSLATDCDDAAGSVYPGAFDAWDCVDQNCDGLPLPTGDGRDGAYAPTGTTTWSTPATLLVSGATVGSTRLTVTSVAGFSSGDLALVLSVGGTGAGAYEVVGIRSVSSGILDLQSALSTSFTTGDTLWVERIPQYSSVDIGTGVTLQAPAWSGKLTAGGGVLAFVVSGTAQVSGTLDANGRGYAGGARATSATQTGGQGEGVTGTAARSYAANGVGGGGGYSPSNVHSCGGGGGHATAGTSGGYVGGYGNIPGAGGAAGGSASLLRFGGGGGAGGLDSDPGGGSYGGAGGGGGGIVLLSAATLRLSGVIRANGSGGESGYYTGGASPGGGGGGAGGSLFIGAGAAPVLSGSFTATGGAGGTGSEAGGSPTLGGTGGVGRIRTELPATATTSPTATDFCP